MFSQYPEGTNVYYSPARHTFGELFFAGFCLQSASVLGDEQAQQANESARANVQDSCLFSVQLSPWFFQNMVLSFIHNLFRGEEG